MLSALRSWRRTFSQARHDARMHKSQPFTPILLWAGKAETEPRPTQPAAFDSNRAFQQLEQQCAIGPRIPGTASHQETLKFLLQELGRWSDTVAVQQWEQRIHRGPGIGTSVPLTNIFARLNAEPASKNAQPPLMLCTHWDTRPAADQDPNPGQRSLPVPGANDGASGVAVLLELARVLHSRPPDRDVIFACFDGEDLGEYYYGSRMFSRHIHHPSLAQWRPGHAILLDMVGKSNLVCNDELNSREQAPELWEAIYQAAQRRRLEARFQGATRRISDDHLFLNAAGIPSILLIDYAYPYWHTTGDTVDKCSPESLRIIAEVLLEYLFPSGN